MLTVLSGQKDFKTKRVQWVSEIVYRICISWRFPHQFSTTVRSPGGSGNIWTLTPRFWQVLTCDLPSSMVPRTCQTPKCSSCKLQARENILHADDWCRPLECIVLETDLLRWLQHPDDSSPFNWFMNLQCSSDFSVLSPCNFFLWVLMTAVLSLVFWRQRTTC